MNKENHESSALHVAGQAVYIDDIAVDQRLLHGYVFYSPIAHANIVQFDIDKAKKYPGVFAILSAQDIPGENQMGPVVHDQPALANGKVTCIGEAIFLIAAKTEEIAREAAKLIEIEFEPLPAILTFEDAIKNKSLLQEPRKIEIGDIKKAFAESDFIIEDTLTTGAQEHWYLETQACLCIPGEENEITAHSSTQNPNETQAIISEVLGIDKNEVEVICRRMGGAFGGKETEANHVAAWTALLCKATGRPVKIKLSRDDDQIITGKRHPFLIKYKAGFSREGKIIALDAELNSNAGNATDLSMAILERAMLHAENAYFIPNARIIGKAYRTNLPSNTAYRGFGGPQGMAMIEHILDKIARKLKKEPLEIRQKNFYNEQNNLTPYGQIVENNKIPEIYAHLISKSGYEDLRKQTNEFNAKNKYSRQGLALTPVKFGISFTTSFLNQAGALVNIYDDGSVLVNQGGTEMGQGLYTKIRQIAALELGINLAKVKVNATTTSKIPNTSPTAASSGTDLNGMAVKDAIEKLKRRIAKVVCEWFNQNLKGKESIAENLVFENNIILDSKNPRRMMPFEKAIPIVRMKQESLSATGYYRTPDIHFNRATGTGKPFHYFAFGMAVSQIEIDLLTGMHKILKTYIVHDVGNSINPNIDKGQIEGGFIQGLGWVTTEECKYDNTGKLLNYSPDTYKIPSISDIPDVFEVDLLPNAPNPNTIRQSKAVGEPPFMLAISVWMAIRDALSSVCDHTEDVVVNIPATNEVIVNEAKRLMAIKKEISGKNIPAKNKQRKKV